VVIDPGSQSFGLGRPPGISSIHVDCQLPLYEEDDRSPDGCKHSLYKVVSRQIDNLQIITGSTGSDEITYA